MISAILVTHSKVLNTYPDTTELILDLQLLLKMLNVVLYVTTLLGRLVDLTTRNGLSSLGKIGGGLNNLMKIQYRQPTLVEQMTEAIETAKKPIEAILLTQSEFDSVFGYLDKTKVKDTVSYTFKGIAVKVNNE